ncbi:SDR family NAD(P)-dependent oxidoreductase [Sphingobacterium siyangense]|uniref:NADP-dependent 3-hydroxy acid dehydrogenase YdfG n=1 Tax=Sphingobacterium siyangense TaxID=459529 RepID=A0A562LZL9_9SPHI|nr:SDR family NAD(P)-dependent oxidoreductase [Sphingobacterium siyangense]TWI13070.1 NADP-dependent 3-hydroxy acid dehydrogenase YdfG [Sphingobacterium siyangense]
MSKKILITGASKGFGKLWAEAFLERGDQVAVTARDINALKDLTEKYGDAVVPIRLDVNNRADCFQAVNEANEKLGGIDVLFNNAGYGLIGAIEETSEEQVRSQMETNFFGLVWLSQAVLPIMRAQGSGHIIQTSSYLGLVTIPLFGLYNASKFAVEGFSATLASEVKSFGINVTLIEPNGYKTDWAGSSQVQTESLAEYDQLRKHMQDRVTPDFFGEPTHTVDAVLKLVDAENPPLHLLFGKVAYPAVKQAYDKKIEEFELWKDVSESAH